MNIDLARYKSSHAWIFVFLVLHIAVFIFVYFFLSIQRSSLPSILGYVGLYFNFLWIGFWIHKKSIPIPTIHYLWLSGIPIFLCVISPGTPLSDDVYRYQLDGCLLLDGWISYDRSPIQWQDMGYGFSRYHLINHPEVPTVYSPIALIVFALIMSISSELWIWRLFFTLILISTSIMFYRLIAFKTDASEVPKSAALFLFIANPWIIIETVIGLHYDILILWVIVYILAMEQRRNQWGLAIGFALLVLLKVHFLVLGIIFFRYLGWKRMTFSLGIIAVGFLLFLVASENWIRFSEPGLYQINFLSGFRPFLGWEFFSGLLYRIGTLILSPSVVQMLMGLVVVVISFLVPKRVPISLAIAVILLIVLLGSPVVHPWYFFWVLPLILVNAQKLFVWILWSWSQLFSYLVFVRWDTESVWEVTPLNQFLIYIPVIFILSYQGWMLWKTNRKSSSTE